MSCKFCKLKKFKGSVTYKPIGSDNPDVMFIADSYKKDDISRDAIFSSDSHKKFRKFVEEAGIDISKSRFSYLVRCPYIDKSSGSSKVLLKKVDFKEAMCCSRFIEAEISKYKPKIIVALGPLVVNYFTGIRALTTKRGAEQVVQLPSPIYLMDKLRDLLDRNGTFDEEIETFNSYSKVRSSLVKISNRHKLRQFVKDFNTSEYTVVPMSNPSAMYFDIKGRTEAYLRQDLQYVSYLLAGGKSQPRYKSVCYTLVNEPNLAEEVVNELLARFDDGEFKYLAVDLETNGLNPYDITKELCTIGVSPCPGEAYTFAVDHKDSVFKSDAVLHKMLRNLLSELFQTIPVIGHNFKFDYNWLVLRGFKIGEICGDTQLASWVLFNDTKPHDLETLTSNYTDLISHKHEFQALMEQFPKSERYNLNNYSLEDINLYNCGDVDGTYRLNEVFVQMMKDADLYEPYVKYAVPAFKPVAHMEMNGCSLDSEFLLKCAEDMQVHIDKTKKWFIDKGLAERHNNKRPNNKFNPASSTALSVLLFDVLGVNPIEYGKKKHASGYYAGKRAPSASAEVLVQLKEDLNAEFQSTGNPDAKLSLETIRNIEIHKKLSSMLSKYVRKMPELLQPDNLLHCNYGIMRTDTLRFSCKEPALQTLPKKSVIKKAFDSRYAGGWIVSADQSQAELRILAVHSGDKDLLHAFENGLDIHRYLASKLKKIPMEEVEDHVRTRVKAVIFGLIYGRGDKAIAEQENVPVEEVAAFRRDIYNEFKSIESFIKDRHDEVDKYGSVRYLTGFRRVIIKDPVSSDAVGRMHRQAVNSPIQGATANIATVALINTFNRVRRQGYKSKLIQYVHDSITFDCPPGEAYMVSAIMYAEMQKNLRKHFKFLTINMAIDFVIGINLCETLDATVLPDRVLKLTGPKTYWNQLKQAADSWDYPPEIFDYKEIEEIEIMEASAIAQSRTSGGVEEDNKKKDMKIEVYVRFPVENKNVAKSKVIELERQW